MFDGVPDQFHHFIASSRASSLSLPLSFPLQQASSPPPPPPPLASLNFPAFDLYPPHHHHLHPPPPHFLQPLHQPPQAQKDIIHEEIDGETSLVTVNLGVDQRGRSKLVEAPAVDDDRPWTSDEVLALFKIRSGMEDWFPEFTWEHVSRKLAELGFRRSAEKCKAKFEEESVRSYTPTSASYPKSDGLLSELEELCSSNHGDHQNNPQLFAVEKSTDNKVGKLGVREEEDKMAGQMIQNSDGTNSRIELRATVSDASEENYKKAATDDEDHINRSSSKGKKRKRSPEERLVKYELFKGLCESVVQRLMVQQEEMHSKLLDDMVRREKEMVEREEAWKRQEMERMNKELDARAHELAMADNRQATIIEFLKKFASFDGDDHNPHLLSYSSSPCSLAEPNSSNPNDNSSTSHMGTHKQSHVVEVPPSSSLQNQNHSTCSSSLQCTPTKQDPSSASATMSQTESRSNQPTLTTVTPQNHNPLNPHQKTNHGSQNSSPNVAKDQDLGKRWPRDEVQALINLRCSLYGANNNEDHKLEGSNNNKAPLWERISQKMLELGYERSAKRCKEKWENINKYFRKTQNNDKKRSLDSRTCPYFHQLSHLYSQGKLAAAPPADQALPESHPALPQTSPHKDSSAPESGPGNDKSVANQVAPADNSGF